MALLQLKLCNYNGGRGSGTAAHPGEQQTGHGFPHQEYPANHSAQNGEALESLKAAEREVQEQLRVTPDHPKTNQLAGITYNNLACYYKK